MSIKNPKWENAIKQVDPNFEGSIHQKLGLSDILCPTCGAHCKVVDGDLMCLNACHLVSEAREKFHKLWVTLSGTDIEDIISRTDQ